MLKFVFCGILLFGLTLPAYAQSTGHIGHGGGSGDESCVKARVSRQAPAHLATVAPGSEFTFAVSGALGPNHIHVSVKQQTVPVTFEDKETFLWVHGKLPAELKNTTARIAVKVMSKVKRCDAEEGWLVKIGE
jgi:hypothetical protein